MLAEWETFYLVLGTCAGALVGVMFIVVTLAGEIAVEEINRGTVIYHSPTVFHLAVIVAVSAAALVPAHLIAIAGWVFAASGLCGLIYAGITLKRTFERYDFYNATSWDRLFFGVLPVLCYVVMLGGGLAVEALPELAPEAIAAATLVLLLVAIRNAWDVATFSVRVARSQRGPNNR